MPSTIKPGKTVTVKIVNAPTNAAAIATIKRVLAKDETVKAEHLRQRKVRRKNYNPTMRGGRLYGGRVVKQHPIKGRIGEQGTILATNDVIRDLNSIARFIEVS